MGGGGGEVGSGGGQPDIKCDTEREIFFLHSSLRYGIVSPTFVRDRYLCLPFLVWKGKKDL